MSAELKPPGARHRVERALEALFREARLLERRRRRRRTVLALVACVLGAALGYLVANVSGGSRVVSGDRPISVAVSSVSLPKSGKYFSLAVVDGRVVLSGGPQGSLFPSGMASTASGRPAPVNSKPTATCDSAVVDTSTLHLNDRMTANCANPALYHERAIAVSYWVNSRGSPSGTLIETRIARIDPAAPDGYTLGPVVIRYPQCSDCWAQQIYGDGSLWIYDQVIPAGSRFAQVGQLLRISESTGAVVQRWQMPSIDRPLVAVNADGFWFAPSNESGWPQHTPQSQLIRYRSLYHVWPGAHAPVRVLAVGGNGDALWLVASGHSVWLDANHNPRAGTLWRLTGMSAKASLIGAYPARSTEGGEYGEGAPTYAGNGAIGIYYVTANFPATGAATQRITRLSPDAAIAQTVAAIPVPASVTPNSFGFSSPAAVSVGRSFFFLDPPGATSTQPSHGSSVLYRMTPRT